MPATVNGRLLVQRLMDSGLHPRDGDSKRALFDRVLDAFGSYVTSSAAPAQVLWVPGRLEVFGKHTDYGGGHSLVAALPRGFCLAACPRADGAVRLLDAARGQSVTLPAAWDTPDSDAAGWRRYAAAVVSRLSRNFPGLPLAADIVFASDLPAASGMSSSSALMVGITAILGRLAAIEQRPEWRDNIRTPAEAAGYYACIENGRPFGTLLGDAGVGTHGGSEDHIAIVCGGSGQLSAWRFIPIEHVTDVRMPEGWTFVIASSGVAAKKTGPAQEAYNRLSKYASVLLDLWNSVEGPHRSLYTALMSDEHAPEKLLAVVRRQSLLDSSNVALERRMVHFLREDARVLAAVDAFRTADAERLSRLAEASQLDAERLLQNQVPETIALAQSARDLGAAAASSFGAGFGGSVWALVGHDIALQFAERWLADYRERFPARTNATTFVASPGPPLTVLV